MKKTVTTLALAGSLALFGAGAAHAAPFTPLYVPGATQGSVDDATVAPGETVVFSGAGFLPGETVEITVDFQPTTPSAAALGGGFGASIGGAIPMAIVFTGTTTADADGNFSFPVTLEEEGVYTLTATGVESGNTVTAVVAVDAAFAGAPVAGGGTGTAGNNGAEAAGSTGGLANTGVDSAMLLWGAAGIGALGLGAASVVVARRRADA